MNVNRRSFFGMAAVSPLAAKEAARQVIEQAQQAAQLQAGGISFHSDSLYTGVSTSSVGGPMRSLWEAFQEMGVPDWKQEDLREDARRSRTLDPDLAAMKSFSLSSKMRMQWQRNYEVLVERALRQTQLERVKRSFFASNPDISEY